MTAAGSVAAAAVEAMAKTLHGHPADCSACEGAAALALRALVESPAVRAGLVAWFAENVTAFSFEHAADDDYADSLLAVLTPGGGE